MSKSFATALWLVDNVLELAFAGGARAMVHSHPEHEYVSRSLGASIPLGVTDVECVC